MSPQPRAEVAQEGAANLRTGLVLEASPPSVESCPQPTALLCPTSGAWKHQQCPAGSSHHLPFIPNGPTSKEPALSRSPHQEKLWHSLAVFPVCTSTQGLHCALDWVRGHFSSTRQRPGLSMQDCFAEKRANFTRLSAVK